LGDFLFRMGVDGAVLSLSSNLNQLLHVFHVLLVRFSIPEDHAELHSVGLLVGEDKDSV
jgi:hypothetical protein